MSTTRSLERGVVLLGLVALLLSYGLTVKPGQAADEPSYSDANGAASAVPSKAMTGEPELKRASRIVGAKVKSTDGITLGRIRDLVLTADLNSISYVAVSSPGMLGIGSTLHAVPWSALTESVNETYAVPVTAQQFKQSRGFRPAYWPSSAENVWVSSSTETSRSSAEAAQGVASSKDVKDRRFSRIRGANVSTPQDRHVGDVHDLVIVMDTGRIAYTVVSYGGLAGIGARYTAVPASAVTLEPARHIARIEATEATLHANSFTPGKWPDLANPGYARQLDRAYGVTSAETALAYVPAGPVAAAPATKTPRAPARSTTPPVSGTKPSAALAAEPTPDELTGTFNASSITALDGTVSDEGKFRATAAGPEMLWLRVRTDDGRTVLVNLGPRSYISAQDFYIVRGDRIHLSGSEVAATTSGKRVFLPTEVTYNSHALHLRSTTGTPLWEGPATTTTPTTPAPQPGTASPSAPAQPQSRARASEGSTALGYTPAQEPGTPSAAGPPMTSFAPAGLIPLGAFDTTNSRTIDGTVTEVGKSQTPSGPDVLWMRVRTTEGQWLNVQIGPRDYVAQKDFLVVAGDRVHLTGWEARAAGAPGATPVFVVADISQDGHTLQLRNRSGEPLWISPSLATPGSAATGRSARRTGVEPNEPNKP